MNPQASHHADGRSKIGTTRGRLLATGSAPADTIRWALVCLFLVTVLIRLRRTIA